MNYIYLESNWHIVQGDKTACGMDIPEDAETAAPQLAPQCPMCWVRREPTLLEQLLKGAFGEGYVVGETLTNDPNTWGEALTVTAYDTDGTAALLRIDYNEPPVSS